MTTIIGVQYEKSCIIVADSLVSDNDNGSTWSHPDMTKINKRGDFLIAGSGEVSPCDIAQHIWNPPKPTTLDRKDIYHFMITKAMPSFRECLKDNDYTFDEGKEPDSKEPRFGFLMSVNGELFEICDDLSILRSDGGFYGVGTGAALAIGALHAGATPQEAVEIACKVSMFSALPIQVMTQDSK